MLDDLIATLQTGQAFKRCVFKCMIVDVPLICVILFRPGKKGVRKAPAGPQSKLVCYKE